MTDIDISCKAKIDFSPQAFAEATKIAIDAFKQAEQREKTVILENKARESELADKAQARLRATQKAEHEKKIEQLELLDHAIDTAIKLVDTTYPRADKTTRAKEIQVTLNKILQYLNEEELEPALSAPQTKIIVITEDKLG